MRLDGRLRLRDGHAIDNDTAINTQPDRAIGSNQMRASDLLLTPRLCNDHADLIAGFEAALQLLLNRLLGLFDSHATHSGRTVVEPEVDRPFWFDAEDPKDRLVREGFRDL